MQAWGDIMKLKKRQKIMLGVIFAILSGSGAVTVSVVSNITSAYLFKNLN